MVPRPTNGLSLCAGGGGLDMGLMLAEPGFHTRCYVEWEPYPRSSIIAAQAAGYFAPAPIWDDITTFDATPLRGAIDTILAGYPCQGESYAGKRELDKADTWLWEDVARIIEEVAPTWVILENVEGHITGGAETVLRRLLDMGFTPATGLFTAAETGATHKRPRWFCVAYANGRNTGKERQQRSGQQRFHPTCGRSGSGNVGYTSSEGLEIRGKGWWKTPDQKNISWLVTKPKRHDSNVEYARRNGRVQGWHGDYGKHDGNQPNAAGGSMADTGSTRTASGCAKQNAGIKGQPVEPFYNRGSLHPPPPQMTPLAGHTPCQNRQISRRLLRSVTSHVTPTTLRRWLRRGNWKKKRLNPLFVEWLMGWPKGHSLLSCSETAFTHWKQHMRSALYAMPTAYGPWIWQPPIEVAHDEQLALF